MRFKYFFILVFLFIISTMNIFSQTDTSKNNLEDFRALNDSLESFFMDHDAERFLNNYFKQLDLINKIEDNELDKLTFYAVSTRVFGYLGITNEAIGNGEKFRLTLYNTEGLKELLYDKSVLLGSIFAVSAQNYHAINAIDKETRSYKDAINYWSEYGKDYLRIASSYNNYGIHLRETLRKVDSSIYYFNKANRILISGSDNPHYLMGSIRDNLANAYLDKRDYKIARRLFVENYHFYEPERSVNYMHSKKPDYERWLRAGIQIANTDLRLGNLSQASTMIKEIDSLLQIHNYQKKTLSVLLYLKTSKDIYLAKNNYIKANYFEQERKHLLESFNLKQKNQERRSQLLLNEKVLEQAQENFELKNQHILDESKAEKLHYRNIVIFLILAVIIAFFCIIFYYQKLKGSKKNKQIAEQELKLINLKNELLNKEMYSKKRDLSDFAINLSENQKWIKDLLDQFDGLKKLKGRAKGKELNVLEEVIKDKASFNNANQIFHEKIDKLSHSFYDKLRKTFPELNESDIKLCAMIRLGVDNYEIGILHNIHQNSVHQSRYRLKRKLNLTSEQDLNRFLIDF